MQPPAESPRRKHPLEDSVLRHLGEGVLEIDARGRIVQANPAAVELLWSPGASVMGTTLNAVWGDYATVVAAALVRLAQPTAREREVLELNHYQRHLRLTLTRLSPAEGAPGFLAVVQDITMLKRRIEELDALNHVAAILNSTHDLKRVLELAIERIAAALHAEAGSLLLRDDATGELVFTVALGPVADRIRGRRLAPGQGIAGWVARTGKALLVPDVGADPRFSGGVDAASGFVTRSILCTPLKTTQGTIGVVQLLNHTAGRPFSEADRQLLEAISLHAAAVIESARLLERERQANTLVALSNLTEEFGGPLESLGCHLEDLFEAASRWNANLLPTIEKAMERLENLRRLLRHLSRTLPDDSPTSRSHRS
jgi:PAS domain S-box-containing protein